MNNYLDIYLRKKAITAPTTHISIPQKRVINKVVKILNLQFMALCKFSISLRSNAQLLSLSFCRLYIFRSNSSVTLPTFLSKSRTSAQAFSACSSLTPNCFKTLYNSLAIKLQKLLTKEKL